MFAICLLNFLMSVTCPLNVRYIFQMSVKCPLNFKADLNKCAHNNLHNRGCCKCGAEADLSWESMVLDVWFDSGVSHAAVLQGKKADLYFEGGDQYRGWFQSSLLAAMAVRGDAPTRAFAMHESAARSLAGTSSWSTRAAASSSTTSSRTPGSRRARLRSQLLLKLAGTGNMLSLPFTGSGVNGAFLLSIVSNSVFYFLCSNRKYRIHSALSTMSRTLSVSF